MPISRTLTFIEVLIFPLVSLREEPERMIGFRLSDFCFWLSAWCCHSDEASQRLTEPTQKGLPTPQKSSRGRRDAGRVWRRPSSAASPGASTLRDAVSFVRLGAVSSPSSSHQNPFPPWIFAALDVTHTLTFLSEATGRHSQPTHCLPSLLHPIHLSVQTWGICTKMRSSIHAFDIY